MLRTPPAEMNYPPIPKRTRSDIEAEEQADQSFVLKNIASDTSICLEPVSRLLRAHLPLSWLASTVPQDHLTLGSILQGHVQQVGGWEYAVLVVRQKPNGGLVALEKVEDNCFVAQPLQPFVTEKWVRDAAVGAAPSVSLQMMLHYLPLPEKNTRNHRESTPNMLSEPVLNVSKSRKGAAARLSILSHQADIDHGLASPSSRDDVSQPIDDTTLPLPMDPRPVSAYPGQDHEKATIDTTLHSQVAEPSLPAKIHEEIQNDMLSTAYLRQRYLDHLYMTKTSLAYYAKGPLSRARARARAPDSSMDLSDLAAFYRDSILPVKRMDLKYKESLQSTIKHHTSSNDDHDITKKPSRKTRLGKDGLWPMESGFIARWWRARSLEPSASSLDRHSQNMRDAIASLRMREAQMQMVLMLEALSIEAKQREAAQESHSLPNPADVKAESIESDHLTLPVGAKSKKQRNLETDLEAITDRLCIWHSVGLEGVFHTNDEPGRADEEDLTLSRDRLRNFCVDVLIPFYGSKLPQLCRALCKTLAGPEVYEHAIKATRLKDIGRMMAPGAAVKRRVPSASGLELSRILSDGGIPQPSPPALARSSTLPLAAKFKREASELSQRPPSRGSRQPSINFVNREIDLVADAQATASKKRKLDRVVSHKQDLAAAIEALKKPNRHNVSGAYMDEVERRKPDSNRNAVVITATPKGNRRKEPDSLGSERLLQPVFHKDAVIPSSGHKPRYNGGADVPARSSAKKKAVLAAIHNTPSKATNKRSSSSQLTKDNPIVPGPEGGDRIDGAFVLSTPVKTQPARPRTSFSMSAARQVESIGEVQRLFELPDVALQTMNRAMAMPVPSTIYDDLGWNDDFDD